MGVQEVAAGRLAAMARGRLRLRHRPLLHRGARTGLVGGGWLLDGAVRDLRRDAAPAVHVRSWSRLAALGIAAGFAVATVKTALIDHPVLRFSASGVTVAGFVELREESQHTDRFVLRVERIDGGRIDEKPQRVRLSVKRGMAPPAGLLCRSQGAARSAAAAARARQLRFRPRSLFPAHRRFGLRARRDQDHHAAVASRDCCSAPMP